MIDVSTVEDTSDKTVDRSMNEVGRSKDDIDDLTRNMEEIDDLIRNDDEVNIHQDSTTVSSIKSDKRSLSSNQGNMSSNQFPLRSKLSTTASSELIDACTLGNKKKV